MRLASSLERLGTETAFDVLARAQQLEAQGRPIINLGIGAPDAPTPAHIVEAANKALRDGYTRYCPAAGMPELREACADYLSRTRQLAIRPDRVLIAPGAKPFLFYTIMSTCQPGDEAIYPDPGFPIYASMIRYVGATPVPLPLREEAGFAFTADDLAERLTPRTRLVILNSPGNPTGGVIPAAVNEALAALLAQHDCYVLSDEVYSEMAYDAPHDSITSHRPDLAERTILLDGFSKTFSMTGWRLGYAACPKPLIEPITRLIINSVSCTPPAYQLAGVAALTGSFEPVREMVEEFRARRDIIVDGLNDLPGVRCQRPGGAFYAFPNITGTGCDAHTLQDQLLEQAGVATVSGTAFGEHGEGYLRVSYANTRPNLQRALESMRTLLERVAVRS
jgi:aspartate aminotransferase